MTQPFFTHPTFEKRMKNPTGFTIISITVMYLMSNFFGAPSEEVKTLLAPLFKGQNFFHLHLDIKNTHKITLPTGHERRELLV